MFASNAIYANRRYPAVKEKVSKKRELENQGTTVSNELPLKCRLEMQ